MTTTSVQPDFFRDTVRQLAATKGWPSITYEAVHYTNAQSQRVVTSGLFASTDPSESLSVTVGPGEEQWDGFFKQAIYYDVAAANAKLSKLD